MAENSKIEWCHHTFNPWIGCTKVGPGCDNCYAEADFDKRRHVVSWGAGQPRKRTAPSTWAMPIRWNAEAQRLGIRYRVFCASLADVADNEIQVEWRRDLFERIRVTPYLDWLIVTKRIGNFIRLAEEVIRYIEAMPGWSEDGPPHSFEALRNWLADWVLLKRPPANVWIGITVVNQEEADRDIPKLLAVPAAVRFLSMEPLLGPVSLTSSGRIPADEEGPERIGYMVGPDDGKSLLQPTREGALMRSGLHWVIVGGESGPKARPMHPQWARDLRDQCAAAGVPFLFKQWGEWHTAAFRTSDGAAVFRQFDSFDHWVAKAKTWVNGGICLDRHGREMKIGADMARAQKEGSFPVTIMHRVGKKTAGRLLDGVQHDGYPEAKP